MDSMLFDPLVSFARIGTLMALAEMETHMVWFHDQIFIMNHVEGWKPLENAKIRVSRCWEPIRKQIQQGSLQITLRITSSMPVRVASRALAYVETLRFEADMMGLLLGKAMETMKYMGK